MVHFHEISAGHEANKISIRDFSKKRVRVIAFAIAPALLLGCVGNAVDTSSILSCDQCKELVDKAESMKKASKSFKALKLLRQGSGYYTNGAICKAAFDKSVEGMNKTLTPMQVIVWSTLMLVCGALTTLNFLED